MLGLQSRELVDYVTRLLADFARTDELYRIRDARGRRLETVASMLLELMRAWNSAVSLPLSNARWRCGAIAVTTPCS